MTDIHTFRINRNEWGAFKCFLGAGVAAYVLFFSAFRISLMFLARYCFCFRALFFLYASIGARIGQIGVNSVYNCSWIFVWKLTFSDL